MLQGNPCASKDGYMKNKAPEYLEKFKIICQTVSPTNPVPINHVLKNRNKNNDWVSFCGKTFGPIYDFDSNDMPAIEKVRIGKCCRDAIKRKGLTLEQSLPGWKAEHKF